MHIAIVDDDPTLRISLKHFLHSWAVDNSIPCEMNEYDDGDSFLAACKGQNFDIVFMDIYMSQKNGIETAEEMRISMPDTVLVFLTSSADHMPDAFSVHAFGYLLKPLLPEKLFKVMRDVQKILPSNEEPFINIMIGKVSLDIKYSDIYYINSDSNYCVIHCPDPRKCRGPFSVITDKLLSSPEFCLINRGLCVNMSHVQEMNMTDCIMTNGDLLPINTKKSSAIRQQYQSYILNKSH